MSKAEVKDLARSIRSQGPKFALAGRVVTMHDDFTYVDRRTIVAVQGQPKVRLSAARARPARRALRD
jgi:hypothetical protein